MKNRSIVFSTTNLQNKKRIRKMQSREISREKTEVEKEYKKERTKGIEKELRINFSFISLLS